MLSVVSAIPMTDTSGFDGVAYSPEADQAMWNVEIESTHAELTQTAEALHGTTVEKRAEIGDAASTICSVAGEIGADVIILGSHGRTGMSRLFLGSTSEHVVRHAPCPVLVVRAENPA